MLEERIRARLTQLSARLGNGDRLDGTLSAGDLLMAHTLQRLKFSSPMLDEFPNLSAYIAHAQTRPAYKRAIAALLAVFENSKG
jgi:glutathione S-transferase